MKKLTITLKCHVEKIRILIYNKVVGNLWKVIRLMTKKNKSEFSCSGLFFLPFFDDTLTTPAALTTL